MGKEPSYPFLWLTSSLLWWWFHANWLSFCCGTIWSTIIRCHSAWEDTISWWRSFGQYPVSVLYLVVSTGWLHLLLYLPIFVYFSYFVHALYTFIFPINKDRKVRSAPQRQFSLNSKILNGINVCCLILYSVVSTGWLHILLLVHIVNMVSELIC